MRALVLALSAFALSACASATGEQAAATPVADRDCFQSASVRSYNVIDNRHVSVDVGASRTYILTTMWNARDLDWSQAIAIRSTSGFICTGNGLGVEVIGGRPRNTYPIVSIERAPEPAPQAS